MLAVPADSAKAQQLLHYNRATTLFTVDGGWLFFDLATRPNKNGHAKQTI